MSGCVRLIWLALWAPVLAACFDVETHLALNAQGGGTLAVTLRADPIFASAPQLPPQILDEVEGKRTVRSEIVGSQYVHQEQVVFSDIAALARHGVRLERIAGGTTIRFVQVVEKPTPQQRQELALARPLLAGRYFTSVVELPGRIVDVSPLVLENGVEVRPEVVDRMVTWRMPLMALIDARTTELTIDYEAPSPRRQPEPTVVAEVGAVPPEPTRVTQPAARDPRRPAYPILFLHGIASDASTWDELKVHLEGELGWTFGGRLAIMPYDGVTCTFERPCAGFWGRGARGDFYTANFADARANYANGKGIIQQGREVGAFLARLRELFGDDQRFIIIAHSMGGLAARSYLAELDTAYFGDVAELITYGTPHNGSPFGILLDSSAVARWFARLRLHIRKDDHGVRDMTPGASAFLPALWRAGLRDDVRHTAIVSTVDCREPVPGYAWPSAVALILFDLLGPSDCVVAVDSQNLRTATGVSVEQRQKVTLRLSNRSHVAGRGIPGETSDHERILCALRVTCPDELVARQERARAEATGEGCRQALTPTYILGEACAYRFARVRRGESHCGITLCEDDRIYLNGRAIGEPIVSWGRPEELVVFPASPGGRYRIVDACGSNCGRSFVLDLQQNSMQDTFAGRYGPEENWIGWSPDGAYAALAYKTEGVAWLYVIRVSDGTSWELLNEGLLVRPESLRWLDSVTFEVRALSCRNGLEACWTSAQGGATGDRVRVTLTANGPEVEYR